MIKPEFFTANESPIAWYQTGTGKPLLILHGWGSDSNVMLPVAKSLSDIRTCYLLDLPGFGESPEPPTAWSVSEYADAVEAFILHNFKDQKIDLFVHSFGARVAIKMLNHKQAAPVIDKVIFTGAAGLKPKRKLNYYLRKYSAKALKLPFSVLPNPYRERGLDRLRNSTLWKSMGSSDYQQLTGVMRETFVKTVTEFLDPYIPTIEHEILLMWGENDPSTPLEQAYRMDKALKHSALITLSDTGHYAFLEKPAEFTSIMRAYLEPKK
jgi:pimeloyl-ACP methyl ester carboxylesterase